MSDILEINEELKEAAKVADYFYIEATKMVERESINQSVTIKIAELMRKEYSENRAALLYQERTEFAIGTIEYLANAIFDIEPVEEDSELELEIEDVEEEI